MPLLQFTWWELVAVLGLIQSVYLLVYMGLRVRRLKHTGVALLCFFWLGAAFFADFGTRYLSEVQSFSFLQLTIWAGIAPVSALLAVQIAKIRTLPQRKYFLLLILPFVAGGAAWAVPDHRREALEIVGILVGGISLLALWVDKTLLESVQQEKNSRQERFWLILSLVGVNLLLLFSMLLDLSGMLNAQNFLLIRDILGVTMVYLASTSLFRIYPQALAGIDSVPSEGRGGGQATLSEEEQALIPRIENLISLEKVYQEPGFSRTTLARELNAPESAVSKVINAHFGKSLPQLLNEKRVEDAIRLLEQTGAPISVIAEQVGFSSIPSFNRVFREVTGATPSDFRSKKEAGSR
jgi:AraC-like DNA-binding protein